MYGISSLKQRIVVTERSVECHVSGCTNTVARARRGEPLRQRKLFCSTHEIFISPSTFEYEDEFENLLWNDGADRELLATIKKVKRESRFARDNSEDALTWNTFRYLEKSATLDPFVSSVVHAPVSNAVPSYWSCSTRTNRTCQALANARREFGEPPERSSEPDVIIEASGKMIWIEAKLGSTNGTTPSHRSDLKQYVVGGGKWFEKVFVSTYDKIAVAERRYELMRLWLLGSWVAEQSGAEFYLINLTPEKLQEAAFQRNLADSPKRHFIHTTWEQFYRWLDTHDQNEQKTTLLHYLRDKSAGYTNGVLKAAFPSLAQRDHASLGPELTNTNEQSVFDS